MKVVYLTGTKKGGQMLDKSKIVDNNWAQGRYKFTRGEKTVEKY